MPAPETVDLAHLAQAPPTLARFARGVRDHLPPAKQRRLGEIVARIRPDGTVPGDVENRAARWFLDTYLPALLRPIGANPTEAGHTLRELTGHRWAEAKHDLRTSWLDAWDAAAAAIWSCAASVVWQEMGSQRPGWTPAWDAATNAARVIVATKPTAEFDAIFDGLQDSVLDLFELIVEATR